LPLPTLLFLAFASGLAAALGARAELRVSPRPAMLTKSFGSYMLFAGLVLVPVSAYFYVFHGDWFLLYLVDVRRVPSALALLGFLLEAGVGAAGFSAGAVLVRSQRETIGGALTGLAVLGALAVVVVARERLRVVGSYAQFEGGFGLDPYGSGALWQGTAVMTALLLVGLGWLLARLHIGSRRA